jgi:hypothetical protein
MSEARTAGGFDRLPWLADEPKPRTRRASRALAWGGGVALLAVAGASFWIAGQSVLRPVAQTARPASTTVALPEPRSAPQPQVIPDLVPQVQPPLMPTVRPAPEPQVRLQQPEPPASTKPAVAPEPKPAAPAPAATTSTAPAASAPRPLSLWPSRVSSGAYGRLIQVGAFGSRYQAKRGWWAMVRAYPALKRLPTVVNDSRNSKGRLFYRLQIGTTSQAHSEVLCQRMEKIHYSCAVVGLPWKPRGVER